MRLQSLPPLASFPAQRQPAPEAFGAALRDSSIREIRCSCEPSQAEAAAVYAQVLGIRRKFQIVESPSGIPYAELAADRTPGVVPLFVDSAINPMLADRFFRHPEVVHFADHQYMPAEDRGTLMLHTVGTTAHGLQQLPRPSTDLAALQRERSARAHELLGDDLPTCYDIRDLLASDQVRRVRLHALGPRGTNIQQASEQYIDALGLQSKADLLVHPRGVTPVQYAEMARQDMAEGVVPLHMECAVYFGMANLYRQRVRENLELLLADHHYMPLDEMQLAGNGALAREDDGMLRIASHGSPKPLVAPWIEGDAAPAVCIDATSNAAAADMVRGGEAELCITTESGRKGGPDQSELTKAHSFGSPMMVFTLGTPYTLRDLRTRFGA